jgi:thiamine biosynthesis lipoprotein ApbE
MRSARPLLGTFVEVEAIGAAELAVERAVALAFDAIERVHRLMSFHDPDSDLSRLNRLVQFADPGAGYSARFGAQAFVTSAGAINGKTA